MSTTEKFVLDLDGFLPIDVLMLLATVLRSETVAGGGSDSMVAAIDSDIEAFTNMVEFGIGLDLGEYFDLVWFYTDELEAFGVTVTGY